MKLILLLATVIAATQCLSVDEQWIAFKENHGKSYTNYEEEKRRFEIFQDNLLLIQQHNSRYEKGETTYYMGITKFSDITDDEFTAMFPKTSKITKTTKTKNGKVKVSQTSTTPAPLPDSVDWKAAGAIPPVLDQGGECSTGYAISSADSLSAQLFITHNKSVQLSAQEIIDCGSRYGVSCIGGKAFESFIYVMEKGLRTARTYPFTGKQDTCNTTATSMKSSVKLYNFLKLELTDAAIQQALAEWGPVNGDIYANSLIRHYKGGIYDDLERCPNDIYSLNHGVLIVGYGTTNGTDYWYVKNSWGTKWGEEGYFRLRRNPSICGINMNGHRPYLL